MSRLYLGAAQIGLRYGATNDTGLPTDEAVRELLDAAYDAHFAGFDTARAYGTSEERLGAFLTERQRGRFTAISKLAPFVDGSPREHVSRSVESSRAALQVRRIDVLMSHRAADVARAGVVDAMEAYVDAGHVGALGVSVYSPEEAVASLADPRLTYVQIPLNVLDTRWLDEPFQQLLAQRPDVVVHVRSVFLQGLLLHPAPRWPAWCDERDAIEHELDAAASDHPDRAAFCLAYVRSLPFVAGIVLGFESATQLRQAAAACRAPAMTTAQAERARRIGRLASPRLLNPASW